jgi:hypothetical protein
MTTKIVPLSETEKALFRKTLRNRLWIALIFGIPLIAGVGFMTYQFVDYQIAIYKGIIANNDWDFGSYIFFFFLVFCHIFFFFYAIPFYIKSFKNNTKNHKIVATTTIINIVSSFRTKTGFRYEIHTDYMDIDSYFAVFMNPINLSELQNGMIIEIHHLENNPTDIIKIVKL